MNSSQTSQRSSDPTYNWNRPLKVDLLNAVTSDSTASYTISGESTIQVEIYGTASSVAVTFFTVGSSGTERAIAGRKQADAALSATGAMGDVITFDVSFADQFVVKVASITGGNVSVNGKAI